MKKRIVSLILVLCVCLSVCPVSLAEEDEGDFLIRTQSVTNEDGMVTEERVLTSYRGEGGDVVIPDGVTAIGMGFAWGFSGNTVVTSVVIPDSVTRIGENAFRECPNLRRVQIGNGVTEISKYTFYECPSLTEVVISDSATKIGVNAFDDCTALEWVDLPASVEKISQQVFSYCTSLKKVNIANPDADVDSTAFGYTNLTSYTQGGVVKMLGEKGVRNDDGNDPRDRGGKTAAGYRPVQKHLRLPETSGKQPERTRADRQVCLPVHHCA